MKLIYLFECSLALYCLASFLSLLLYSNLLIYGYIITAHYSFEDGRMLVGWLVGKSTLLTPVWLALESFEVPVRQ